MSSSVLIVGRYNSRSNRVEKSVTIDDTLKATVQFGEMAVKGASGNLENIYLNSFLDKVDNLNKCEGVIKIKEKEWNLTAGQGYRYISTEVINGSPAEKSVVRAKGCQGAITEQHDVLCTQCKELKEHLISQQLENRLVHPNTPLSHLTRGELVQELRSTRSELKQLQKLFRTLTEDETVSVSGDISKELYASIESANSHDNALMGLFWEEQKKAFASSPKGMRWHPMMIRFAIYLQFQSPRAYEALRETGVLRLPNKSTLRDYTNFVQPQSGFQPHVFEELRKKAESCPPEQRYVCLLHDEMKVKADLVFDRRSGAVVGFTNPDTWVFDQDESTKIATHVLVFMVVGINSHIKMSIGHFPTRTTTADILYPLLWNAIAYLEVTCGLKVISSTSDKAPPNQRLYRIHGVAGEAVVYKATNLFAEDRSIFFFSDVPHLLKTIRNNLYKSRPGGTRYLWNNNKDILWSHVQKLYNDDMTGDLYRTKLTYDHVYLTPSSTMSVRLAAQVLSHSVSQIMKAYYGPELSETAKLISLVDRFQFLQDEFLGYFKTWQEGVNQRKGFTKSEKGKMFLSAQTFEGIVMTVEAFTECTKYLLSHGVPYFLSQNFCQDPLEEHFGRHRGIGGRQTNPTIKEFSYQDNKLFLQRQLAFKFNPKGNTAGRHAVKDEPSVSCSPLKRTKHH